MSLNEVHFELLLRGKLNDIKKLLKVCSLVESLSRLGGFVYVRKNFILRAKSKAKGLLPLYKEIATDYGMTPFLRSYIISDFIYFFLLFFKALGNVEVSVNNRVDLVVIDDRGSIILEREPISYLAKVNLKFPGLFRRGCVFISAREDLIDSVAKTVKRGLNRELTVGSCCRGPWSELSNRQVKFLVRSLRNYSLEELFSIIVSLKPSRSEFELRAGLDVFKYGQDVVGELLVTLNKLKSEARSEKLRRAILNVETEIRRNKDKLWFVNPDRDFVRGILNRVKHLSEWARVDKEEFRKSMPIPSKRIVIKLWERSLDDLFVGFYAGTCIALDERKVMHEYIFDPYTLFFRIYVNERPIGHAKVFICKDEGGKEVLYIDYIGLSGGKYERLHEALKLYSLSAVVKYAVLKGYKRVYVAKDIVPALRAKLVKNKLVKLGKRVYSQYLDKDKFLIWDTSKSLL